jgi:hypothetical protein
MKSHDHHVLGERTINLRDDELPRHRPWSGEERRWTHPLDDWFPCAVCVGIELGSVTNEVCVKVWPFDVWTTKEMPDDEEGLGGVEEVGVEVVEGAALEGPDDEVLAEELEEDELTTELVELAEDEDEDDDVVEEDVGVALGVGDAAGALVADATGVVD